jgi:hypothetical protein
VSAFPPQNDGCYRTLPSFFPLPLSSFLTHFGLHHYWFFFRHLSITIYGSWHQALYLLEISSGYACSSSRRRREIFLSAFLASNSQLADELFAYRSWCLAIYQYQYTGEIYCAASHRPDTLESITASHYTQYAVHCVVVLTTPASRSIFHALVRLTPIPRILFFDKFAVPPDG